MAKTKKKSTKKTNETHAPSQKRAKRSEAEHKATEKDTQAATGAAPASRERDPRLPSPGTVLRKLDRLGKVRCECKVEDDGVRYDGNLYRSLSAAAMAAAKDLGLGGTTQNGFTFWGLSKPPKRAGDQFAALGKVWERYHGRASALIASDSTDENRQRVREAIEQHASQLAGLAKAI